MVEPISAEPADSRREDRRLAIIDAAEALFIEQGFERTSVAAIIKKSGGSLATVYDLFGNKHGLLRAVAQHRRKGAMDQIGCIACEMDSCAAMLTLYAHRLYEHLTAPRSLALIRMAITESLRDPEFGREFHREVHMTVVHELAAAFAAWVREGRAEIDDPEAAAELFLATVIGDALFRAMADVESASMNADQLDWRLAPFLSYFKLR
ncbi:TetR/AcrR family transcriptional regulator [Sphingobium boeckii]|uniref:AcrR family transcriptional regulator n=1 Tax=Sphingobium boeckii TaxID=1082345 RepID=A0A7W9AEK2_9SPHN|nr:TetR/AcrR family transcriptional regulator [Sphingobium boeckii]MBB5684209.1 AcrR family transcriptional regulator [Sphingobium boeckii]